MGVAIGLVVLTDATVHSLMMQRVAQEQFPCLADAAQRMRNTSTGGCKKCGSRSANTHTPDYNTLKTCIMNSSNDKKKWLKTQLNAKRVRVEYTQENGRRAVITFG